MLKIHKQHLAEQDLIQIWLYSFENWGLMQADNYLDKIGNTLELIANNPEIGVNINRIRNGYNKYQINQHIIFYRFNKTRLNIIRVLGNDMDYKQHL